MYDRSALDRLVYQRRTLFEYWAHGACLISTADFPAWRRAMLDYSHRHKGWSGFLKKHPRLIRMVEAKIREGGPLGNADFEDSRRNAASGWWSWKPATHALDFLWMSGRTAVHSRAHFQKRFDLLERTLPEPLAGAPMDARTFRRWHLTRSLHAMGAATALDLRRYLTFPHMAAGDRAATLREMVRDGEVVEIHVPESAGTWYALAPDLPTLAVAGRRRVASRGATLLSPFDSLLWYRERVARVFGFDYRIEVYVPAEQRTFGYYVLPLLVDGQLIGRVDVKLHRRERRLELKHITFEPWFAAATAPPRISWGAVTHTRGCAGLAAAATSLAMFTGAERVHIGRVTPAAMRRTVKEAFREPDGSES